jgi:hypothetical protein
MADYETRAALIGCRTAKNVDCLFRHFWYTDAEPMRGETLTLPHRRSRAGGGPKKHFFNAQLLTKAAS